MPVAYDGLQCKDDGDCDYFSLTRATGLKETILLEAEALNLWRGDSWLVRDLNVAVRAGNLLHVTGPNGSGKTTLLRALAGLTQPESGSITWCGRSLSDDPDAYYSGLAWLGHRDALKPELTAVENLKALRKISGQVGIGIDEALDDAGVGARKQLQVRVLSAGQKRRVALARVFASGARLWILDEPFANLDAQGQRWGHDKVEQHVAAGGVAILTTHLEFDVPGVKRIALEAV